MTTTAQKYIRIEESPFAGKKTKRWIVENIRTNQVCGIIKWYGGFRSYAFFPTEGFLFDFSCLRLIADHLETVNAHHRNRI